MENTNIEMNKNEMQKKGGVKSFPSKKEMEKAFSEKQSSLSFNENDLNKLKDIISIFTPSFVEANNDKKGTIIKSIETLIETHHDNFLKDYKAFKKKSVNHIENGFLGSLLQHLDQMLVADKRKIESGNDGLKMQVIDQTMEVVKSKIETKEDLVLISLLFTGRKSLSKKEALIKLLKENK